MISAPAEIKDRRFYQQLYQRNQAPWGYRDRGGEVLRHRMIAKILGSLGIPSPSVLDIGCGLGELTRELAKISGEIQAFDVSDTAVLKARALSGAGNIQYLVARLPGIPFAAGRKDAVVCSDCIHEFVPEPLRPQAIEEIGAVLKEGGYALFCDYTNAERVRRFEALIERGPFRVVRRVPLNDRLWYQFESWFKAVRGWKPVRTLLASTAIAKIFTYPAAFLGNAGSKHIVIVAKKISAGRMEEQRNV